MKLNNEFGLLKFDEWITQTIAASLMYKNKFMIKKLQLLNLYDSIWWTKCFRSPLETNLMNYMSKLSMNETKFQQHDQKLKKVTLKQINLFKLISKIKQNFTTNLIK